MANKSTSKSAEAYYTRYKTEKRWETNRLKRLERALKRNPENATQIELAMKGLVYRRKTPITRVWSSSKRSTAILFKKFSGSASPELFSSNEKISGAALLQHGNAEKILFTPSWAIMGCLAMRAHTSDGSPVWA